MSTSDGDFESRGPIVLTVSIAMIVCSTVFVGFRLTSRIGIVKKVGWDDYFMAFAWVLAFGLSFSICYGVKYGLGMHEANIPNSQDPPLRRLEYVFTVLYVRSPFVHCTPRPPVVVSVVANCTPEPLPDGHKNVNLGLLPHPVQEPSRL